MRREFLLVPVADGESVEASAERLLASDPSTALPLKQFELNRRGFIVSLVEARFPALTKHDLEAALLVMGVVDEAALAKARRVNFIDERRDGTGVEIGVLARHVVVAIDDTAPQATSGREVLRQVCLTLAKRAELHAYDPVERRAVQVSPVEGAELFAAPGDAAGEAGPRTPVVAPSDVVIVPAPPASAAPDDGPAAVPADAEFVPRGQSLKSRQYAARQSRRNQFVGKIAIALLGVFALWRLVVTVGGDLLGEEVLSIVYTVVVALVGLLGLGAIVHYLPTEIRRRRWRRENRCGACGYPRRGLDDRADCPECGAPSPHG